MCTIFSWCVNLCIYFTGYIVPIIINNCIVFVQVQVPIDIDIPSINY